MITSGLWIANLVEVAEDIANRQHQELRWMAPDAHAWERPEELINVLFDDSVFEGFLEEYSSTFSAEQRRIAFKLRDDINRYCGTTLIKLDPQEVLADPRWETIRQEAAAFVAAFKGKWPTLVT
jgi:hypothetical protein